MKQIYMSLILALLCVPVCAQTKEEKQQKPAPTEVTFAANADAIRAEIIKASAREGWTLCDESESQVIVCDKWHNRVVTRFRFRRRFTLSGSTVLAVTENFVESVGTGGQGTVTVVQLDGKKERTALIKFLDVVRDGLK